MKKTMSIIKRICLVVLLIMGVLYMVKYITYLNSYGENYTKEYTTYKQVASIQKLDELRSKLQELNLEYSIKDSTLAIKNNSLVSFDIKNDDTCYINHNEFIKSFKKLDEEDRSVVEIYGISENGKIKEKIVFKDVSETAFTKMDNEYFAKSVFASFVLIMVAAAFAVVSFTLLLIDLFIYLKKRKKQRIPTVQ